MKRRREEVTGRERENDFLRLPLHLASSVHPSLKLRLRQREQQRERERERSAEGKHERRRLQSAALNLSYILTQLSPDTLAASGVQRESVESVEREKEGPTQTETQRDPVSLA